MLVAQLAQARLVVGMALVRRLGCELGRLLAHCSARHGCLGSKRCSCWAGRRAPRSSGLRRRRGREPALRALKRRRRSSWRGRRRRAGRQRGKSGTLIATLIATPHGLQSQSLARRQQQVPAPPGRDSPALGTLANGRVARSGSTLCRDFQTGGCGAGLEACRLADSHPEGPPLQSPERQRTCWVSHASPRVAARPRQASMPGFSTGAAQQTQQGTAACTPEASGPADRSALGTGMLVGLCRTVSAARSNTARQTGKEGRPSLMKLQIHGLQSQSTTPIGPVVPPLWPPPPPPRRRCNSGQTPCSACLQ